MSFTVTAVAKRRVTPLRPVAAPASPPSPPSAPAKRVRRSPEDARSALLDAADRVFAVHLPDSVGLKEIAREAGVSHALVTHYFKTYAGLVEGALERRFDRLRDTLVTEMATVLGDAAGPAELLAAYRRAVARQAADPGAVRLATWAMMSGRIAQTDFFSHRVQGLKLLADALEERAGIPREDLEFSLIASFALTVTWTVAGEAIAGALGKKKPQGFDAAFEERVARLIGGYLERPARRVAK